MNINYCIQEVIIAINTLLADGKTKGLMKQMSFEDIEQALSGQDHYEGMAANQFLSILFIMKNIISKSLNERSEI